MQGKWELMIDQVEVIRATKKIMIDYGLALDWCFFKKYDEKYFLDFFISFFFFENLKFELFGSQKCWSSNYKTTNACNY